ncbi:MAG: cytochrome P450 [Bacteroidota bacterium]
MATQRLWTPYNPGHVIDPYKMYKRLREEDPVHLSQTNEWVITRYTDVKFVLKSQEFRSGNRLDWLSKGVQYFKNQDEDFQHISSAINSFLLFLNPPDHTKIRSFVTKTWNDHNVEAMIADNVNQLLSKLNPKGFDLVKEFAQPFPVLVISEIMGIPKEDYLQLKSVAVNMQRSLDLYHTYKELVELNKTSKIFVEYFKKLIRLKSERPDNSLISKLILSNVSHNYNLEEKHLISICIFLFTASEETTANTTGTGLYNLICNPEKYAYLYTYPEHIPSAVEELLRFDSPVQLLGRIAKTTIPLGDKVIPEGAALTLVLGSANRDPLQFNSPDELDLLRSPNHHVALSSGIHYCLGDWLGRIQAKIALQLFMDKFPSLKLDDQKLSWNKNLAVRGLQSLLVSAA